jgi:hypothetical protein
VTVVFSLLLRPGAFLSCTVRASQRCFLSYIGNTRTQEIKSTEYNIDRRGTDPDSSMYDKNIYHTTASSLYTSLLASHLAVFPAPASKPSSSKLSATASLGENTPCSLDRTDSLAASQRDAGPQETTTSSFSVEKSSMRAPTSGRPLCTVTARKDDGRRREVMAWAASVREASAPVTKTWRSRKGEGEEGERCLLAKVGEVLKRL